MCQSNDHIKFTNVFILYFDTILGLFENENELEIIVCFLF